MQARLRTLLGNHPVTRAMKSGAVRSPRIAFDFADVKVPNTAFKRVVRDLEFDVAELAIVTFLLARAFGKPLVLLHASGGRDRQISAPAAGLQHRARRTGAGRSFRPASWAALLFRYDSYLGTEYSRARLRYPDRAGRLGHVGGATRRRIP